MKKSTISKRFLQNIGLGVFLGVVLTCGIAKAYDVQITKIWQGPVAEEAK